MATTPMLISIEEYLQTTYRPDLDYVDGELVARTMDEYTHSLIQQSLLFWFGPRMIEWQIDPMQEQRINISSSRFRVCDLALLRLGSPRKEVTLTPPLLCIEILSPEDRIHRAKIVLADYASVGVPQSWLIDPLRREAFTFDSRGLQVVEQDRLELPGTPIYLVLSELFAVLDQQ